MWTSFLKLSLRCQMGPIYSSLKTSKMNYHYISTKINLRSQSLSHTATFDRLWLNLNQIKWLSVRQSSSEYSKQKRSTLFYMSGLAVLVLGLSYAAVPLYSLYCQTTSYGGQVKVGHDDSKLEGMKKIKHRVIQVKFNADTASSMTWNFKPQQPFINVSPGETALAFYTATNPTDRAITGIATYNVIPFEAGGYFNKIQCFCFEEQRLNPHEQVDMPVFFYLDPEYAEDPKLEDIDTLILSYTFFEAKEGLVLPTPAYAKR